MSTAKKIGLVVGLGAVGATTFWALNHHQTSRFRSKKSKFKLPLPAHVALKGETLQAPPTAIKSQSSIVFLGCGASTATPSPACLLQNKESKRNCVCPRVVPQDVYNRNNRGNPALLVKHRMSSDGPETQVQIDIGKTYVSKLQAFHHIFDIRAPDAIVLTHAHSDASSGIDEIRNLQTTGDKPMPLYLNKTAYDDCKGSFGYLMERKGPRHVSYVDWRTVDDFQQISVGSVKMMPLPVIHGSDPCKGPDEKTRASTWGFIFGGGDNSGHLKTKVVAYLSDVSAIPQDTLKTLQESNVDILIIDALLKDKSIWPHFGLPAAIDAAKKINQGKKTKSLKVYLTGMGCAFDYYKDQDSIREAYLADNLDVEMAFDGLQVSIDL